jgi:hypothetical protein
MTTTVVRPRTRAARWAPLGVLTGGLAGCAYLAVNDPSDPATPMPACPFHAVTGLWCAGCGGLRMVHAVLHGRFGEAAQDNAALLAATPFLLTLLAWWSWRTARGERFTVPLSRRWAWSAAAVALAWTVARNLPMFPLQPV